MRWFRFVGLVVFVAVLQASLFAELTVKPDLLLILLVFFAVARPQREAILTSFMIGFTADLIGPVMGPQTLSFGLCGALLASLQQVINVRRPVHQGLIIFLTGLAAGACAQALALTKGEPIAEKLYIVLLSTSASSAVVGPFLFLPLAWWMGIHLRRLGRRR